MAQCYSSDAQAYEKTWAPVLRPHGRRLLDSLPLHDAGRILDAGAGVGALLPDIRERAPRLWSLRPIAPTACWPWRLETFLAL